MGYFSKQTGFASKRFHMNRDTIEGNWKQFTGKVKAKWGKLTGHEIEVIDGKRAEIEGKIQEGYGITKDAVEEQLEDFKKPNND
jgi:uncharacterized protein YjbJ (UPF0337 family)